MRKWRKLEVTAFTFELTDETFGVHSLRFRRGQTAAGEAISINLVCQLAWVAGSLLGSIAGSLIKDVRPFALDYALPAMFIALLVLQLRGRLFVWVAILSGVLSMVIWGAELTQWNVILATVVGATAGAMVETLQKRKAERSSE